MDQRPPKHRVYMSFMSVGGWYCQFLEEDLKTPLPVKLNFAAPEKVTELVRRCGGLSDLASRQALEQAIANGRGGLFLTLTDQQYRRLKGTSNGT